MEFESAQKTLEQETLIRVDFENKIQSLREELEFKSKVHATVSQTPRDPPRSHTTWLLRVVLSLIIKRCCCCK